MTSFHVMYVNGPNIEPDTPGPLVKRATYSATRPGKLCQRTRSVSLHVREPGKIPQCDVQRHNVTHIYMYGVIMRIFIYFLNHEYGWKHGSFVCIHLYTSSYVFLYLLRLCSLSQTSHIAL